MNVARLVKDNLEGFNGHASLYRCDPPHAGHEFVVASTTTAYGLMETYLFPADSDGQIKDWLEMDGSMKETTSHDDVWANAGYQISR
ncbi:hypothetical protein ABE485_02630 [Achromobacter spanius]|uniref:hypothetical protein n=1 Tax=Achromobacter spanius TaxID=217203 RepID=UPI00320827DB